MLNALGGIPTACLRRNLATVGIYFKDAQFQ